MKQSVERAESCVPLGNIPVLRANTELIFKSVGPPNRRFRGVCLALLALCLSHIPLGLGLFPVGAMGSPGSMSVLAATAATAASPLLDVFQVTSPVIEPKVYSCTQTLMVYSFGNSYGQPYVGKWKDTNSTTNRPGLEMYFSKTLITFHFYFRDYEARSNRDRYVHGANRCS